MALHSRRYPQLNSWLKVAVCLLAFQTSAHAIRVPAYVFPDNKSDIITYVEVNPAQPGAYPAVLDASLDGGWYWSTYEGDFVGYVSKREVINRNQLKEGTLIRTNPTYRSWVLSKYERGDKVRIRSRLSVGRVSFKKEIPVYFQMPDAETLSRQQVVAELGTTSSESSSKPDVASSISQPAEVSTTVSPATPMPPSSMVETPPAESAPKAEPSRPNPLQSVAAEMPEEVHQPSTATQPIIAAIPEMIEPTPPEPVDPLLEEKPRIPAQELVNLAPPPADLYQEFEGFLRVVSAHDSLASRFQYQLDTRSGQRIVYVAMDQMRGGSYQDYVDQWINIRGSLDEVGKDFTLFIEARSIWIAPEE